MERILSLEHVQFSQYKDQEITNKVLYIDNRKKTQRCQAKIRIVFLSFDNNKMQLKGIRSHITFDRDRKRSSYVSDKIVAEQIF